MPDRAALTHDEGNNPLSELFAVLDGPPVAADPAAVAHMLAAGPRDVDRLAARRPTGTVTAMNATADTADPTAASIAVYSDHIAAYTAANAGKAGELLEQFLAPLTVDDVILDAGCGAGRDLVRMADAGHCCVGIDGNVDMLEAAAEATDGWPVHLHHGDLRDLPFEDNSFAGTWACASLVHLTRADAGRALAELARVTRPGGPVYSSVKVQGPGGWVDTDHGRRWYRIWDPYQYTSTVTAAGLTVNTVNLDRVFVNVFATA